jgi:hypothetical protein
MSSSVLMPTLRLLMYIGDSLLGVKQAGREAENRMSI